MVQTRSKSSLSTVNVIPSPPRGRKKAHKEQNKNEQFKQSTTSFSCQHANKQKIHEDSLQLEDINSIPDPPTPPNPSVLHKSVAAAVANARRRRFSSSTRGLSGTINGSFTIPKLQTKDSHGWKSDIFSKPKEYHNMRWEQHKFSPDQKISGDNNNKIMIDTPMEQHKFSPDRKNVGDDSRKIMEDTTMTKVDCSNDSDMSIDESDQPFPLAIYEGKDAPENMNGLSICYDDSSDNEKEGTEENRNDQARKKHNIFHTKGGVHVVGRRGKSANVILKKKRSRRSMLLPGEEDDEKEIDFSNTLKCQRGKRCGRGILIPNGVIDTDCFEVERE